MDSLSDDALVHVFLEFGFAQKVQLERVCRRWERILKSRAVHARMQSVNIADFLSESKVIGYADQDNSCLLQDTICGVLDRVGPCLKQLDLGHRWPRIPRTVVDQLAQKCGQLTKLDMGWVRMEADISPLLETVAEQLEHFSLEETSWAEGEHAEKVTAYFGRMRHLKHLNLRKFCHALDDLDKFGGGTMEFLDVSEASQLSADTLCSFLELNPQLLVLHLCPVPPSCLPLVAMSTTSAINRPGPFLGFVQPKTERRVRFSDQSDGEQLRHQRGPQTQRGALKRRREGVDLQGLVNRLGKMRRLRTLWLGHIPYSSHFLSLNALAEMAQLRHLHLKDCNALTGEALSVVLKGLSENLRQLSLLNCGQLDDLSALGLCSVLSQLDVERANRLTDLRSLAQHGRLRLLRLKECPAVGDAAIWAVAERSPLLKELELVNCAGISAEVFFANECFSKLHKLERLSLAGCESITNLSIAQAAVSLHWESLTQLDLSRNRNIDDTALEAVRTRVEARTSKKPFTLCVSGTGVNPDASQQMAGALIELIF